MSDPKDQAADVEPATSAGDEQFERVQRRERREPEELQNPVPRPLAALAIGLIVWGAWYYFQNTGYPVAAGDRRTAIVIDTSAAIDGSAVYAANCVACHQANGGGLAGVFPPLASSEWVLGDDARLVQILLHGIVGSIEVQGQTYAGAMPAFGQLADGEIAAVLTHVRATWGNDASPITPQQVAEGRQRFPDRAAPWNGGDELNAVFPPSSSRHQGPPPAARVAQTTP
ncbi:MAG: c-type cytochrome [Pseudomonadota bacterium]